MDETSVLDWVTAGAAVVAALGTLAAVATALYLSLWSERGRRPELSLALGDESEVGGMGIIGYGEEDWDDVAPVLLQVRAARGKRTAHDVEVLLTAVWRGEAPKYSPDPHTQFDSRPLGWAFVASEAGTPVT